MWFKGIFNIYFLILMVFVGLIEVLHDSKSFEKSNRPKAAKKSKYIGIAEIVISIILFSIAKFI